MAQRKFTLSVVFVGGLLTATVSMAVLGGLAALLQADLGADTVHRMRVGTAVSFAVVVGFALGVTQVATASAQILHPHAGTKAKPGPHRLAYFLAWACAALCACVSVFGVHLGGQFLNGAATIQLDETTLLVAGLGLAFVKPAMSYVTESCRAVERERVALEALAAAEADRAERERQRDADRLAGLERARLEAEAAGTVANLDDHRPATPTPKVAKSGGKGGAAIARKVGAGAAAAVTALAGQGFPADAHANPPAISQAAEQPVQHRHPSMDEIEQARLVLARANAARVAQGLAPKPISQRSVAKQIGVRRSDVEAVWPKGEPLHMEL